MSDSTVPTRAPQNKQLISTARHNQLFSRLYFIYSSVTSYGIMVAAMELSDILPDRFNYDKMRPPRLEGQPAKVFNHLTVMGLDSINENSMVNATSLSLSHILIRLTRAMYIQSLHG